MKRNLALRLYSSMTLIRSGSTASYEKSYRILTAEARLGLLRQLAEALGHAHGKRLYHRGLAPQNVLVHGTAEGQPRLQIMNWQVASRAEGSQTAIPVTSGTRNIDDHFGDPAKVYLAPEALSGGEAGAQADVFSLGAIAYHLFTGRPPADSPLELPAKLREGGGLRLAEAVDGIGTFLEDLVRASTAPVVRDRIASAGEFLEYLALAETDARAQGSTTTVDPSIAKRDDQLEGGFVVLSKLGRGGTADALLVRRDGEKDELVLKVAVDAAHGDRLQAEAAVLRSLRHPNIVRIIDTLTVSGRAAILMERAGNRTLAERLRGDDADDLLSLDLMRRFGEDLLQALNHLEEQGVAHRDIKPDNIGIAPAGGSGRLRLVLFDFSLTRTPPENIQAGTRPYLDPFLALRPQRRWDLHAERYAAAVTLHELVAGVPPTWGDGATEPLVTEDEATIATDRFDPTLREGLRDFFTQALRRNAEERFDNAEEMLRDWRRAFEPLDRGAIAEDSIETIARRLDRRSTIAELGYSVEARDVLDRMGVHTVQQLLAVDRIRFRYLRSVSDKVRREIRERAKRLAEIRPELMPGGGSEDAQAWASVDRLSEFLIPRRPAGDETAEDRLLELYLGLEPADGPVSWPAAGDVAREAGVARSAVAAVLGKARDRWHKSRELNELRTELVSLLSSAGGVATADELAALLLAARGSVEDSEIDRRRLASAVLRASIELEASASDTARFASYADQAPILVALSPELAAHAVALGAIADRMALEDPLPSPGRVEEELNLVAPPDGTRYRPVVRCDSRLPPPKGRRSRLVLSCIRGECRPRRPCGSPWARWPAPDCCPRKPSGSGSEDGSRMRPTCRRGGISIAFLTRWARSESGATTIPTGAAMSAALSPRPTGQPFRYVALWHFGRGASGNARGAGRKVAGRKNRRRRPLRGLPGADGRSTPRPTRRGRIAAPVRAAGAGQPRIAVAARDACRSRGTKGEMARGSGRGCRRTRREGFPKSSSPRHQSG